MPPVRLRRWPVSGDRGLSSVVMSDPRLSPWRPEPAPPPASTTTSRSIPARPRATGAQRLKKYLGPIAAGALLLATKLKAILLLLPKLKILTTSGTMLVSIAAYALIWGFPFAVGFVAPPPRPRDGPRDPAAPRGNRGLGADVHPLPRRRRGGEVARRRRRRRGARRARRPDPRHRSPASSRWRSGSRPGTSSGRRSPTSASSSTSSTCSRSCRSTAAARWRRSRRRSGSSASRCSSRCCSCSRTRS